jgi:hypothetical protein
MAHNHKKFGQEKFDFIASPTSSGDLVKNFVIKLSQVLKFPISHDLVKILPFQAKSSIWNMPACWPGINT